MVVHRLSISMITMVRVTSIRVSPLLQGCCRSKAVQAHTVANSEHGVSGHCVRADRHATHGTSNPNFIFGISFLHFDWVFVRVFLLQLFLKFDLPCECETEEWYVSWRKIKLFVQAVNYDLLLTYLMVQMMTSVLTCSAGTSTICSMNRTNDYVLLAIMM